MATEAEIERMVIRLLGDARQYEATLDRAAGVTKTFAQKVGTQLKAVGQQLQSLGRKWSFRITAPIVTAGAFSIGAFAKFDNAMTESLSLFGNVSTEMRKKMSDLARQMSTESDKSATDLAKSYYFLGSAGLDAQRSMDNLRTVMEFGAAGAFDMARATDILTDAYTALKWSMDDPVKYQKNMIRLSDAMVLASKQANATVEQFGEAVMGDAGGASAQFGMQLETLMGLLGGYASASKKGAEASNMMGRALRMTSEAYLKNKSVWQGYGVEMIDKATGEWRNFIDVIGDMEKAFAAMTGPEKTIAMGKMGMAALQQKAIIPLLGQSDQMKKWEEQQKTSAAGGTKTMFSAQMESLLKQGKQLWNKIVDQFIGIGELLAPYVKKLIGWVSKLVDWWKGLSDTTKKWGIIIAGVLAAVGPFLIFVGTLLTLLGVFLTVLPAIGSALAVIWPVLLAVAAAAAALVVWVIALIRNFKDIKPELISLWGNLQKVWDKLTGVKDAAKTLGVGISNLAIDFTDRLGKAIKTIVIALDYLAIKMGNVIDRMKKGLSELKDRYSEFSEEGFGKGLNEGLDYALKGILPNLGPAGAIAGWKANAMDPSNARLYDSGLKRPYDTAGYWDLLGDIPGLGRPGRTVGDISRLGAEKRPYVHAATKAAEPVVAMAKPLLSTISAPERFDAARAGSAEGMFRTQAYRATGPKASAAERTATEVTKMREILERMENGGEDLPPANLGGAA